MEKTKKICVYAIAKNEEKFVKRWVDSMSEADLIIVGDTGSTDKTFTLLKELKVSVHEIKIDPWRFDDARNKVLSLIPKDYDICVSTDLDESFEKGWREKLETAWKEDTTRLKFNFNWSFDKYGKPSISFLIDKIHQNNIYQWQNPVHEVLKYKGEAKEKIDYALGIVLNHYPDSSKKRSQYLPLLELGAKEDEENDRNIHYLGREYMYYQKWDKSIKTLKKHLNLKTATWKDERCASMRYIARCYFNKKKIQQARKWLKQALNEAPYLREPYVEMAMLEYEFNNWEKAYHFCYEALKINNKSLSYINEPYAWDSTIYDISSICCYHLNKLDEALYYSNIAIELDKDNQQLKETNLLIKNKKRD